MSTYYEGGGGGRVGLRHLPAGRKWWGAPEGAIARCPWLARAGLGLDVSN